MIGAMFAVFAALLVLGVPIIFTLGISSTVYLLSMPHVLSVLPQRLVTPFDSFSFVAVPLFILAGEIMNTGGITQRLINLARVMVGWLRGGLAYVNVVVSMLFGGVQGLATADVAAIGSVLIPAMKKSGYEAGFSTALTVASATIGAIIPPSLLIIIFAMATRLSIGRLFLAGIVPGILIGVMQMALVFMYGRWRALGPPFPPGERISTGQAVLYLRQGAPTMLLPIIILGGIGLGVFTATESAGIAVVYAAFLALVTREMRLSDIPGVLFRAAKLTGSVMLILGTASIFAWILTVERIPHQLGSLLLGLSSNIYVILLLLNLALLVIGTFMDATPAAIILGPVMVPILVDLGMDPIHVGIFMCFNLILGHTTPPVGTCLYIASGISGLRIERIAVAMIPFLVVNFITLMIITYFPGIVLFLPNLLSG
ncbi:MAG: TRAP transporter large permease [Spirochaetaceae bacterium]|nr:MAG: TRAP transporter large permease [Spirochaetaceae bacterium]